MKRASIAKRGRKKALGLALSGGGARGLAHIGIIKVLQREGIGVGCVAGTSIGAVVAAYFALHMDIAGLERIALAFRKKDSLRLIDLNDPRVSVMKGRKTREFLKQVIGDRTFADTKIPLRITATDLTDGSQYVFSKGSILDAVMASANWPGLFPFPEVGGRYLVDGGLAGEIPVLAARQAGAGEVIAVDLFALRPSRKEYKLIHQGIERTYEILMNRLAHYREAEYGRVVMLRPRLGGHLELVDFYNARRYIEAGRKEAERMLPALRRLA